MAMEFVTQLPYDHPYRWDGTLFGGPKLWRPSDIGSPMALWLDAEDTSTITLNGSTVSQWNDKSGNGRNALQGTATSQPAYGAELINGKPALSFDGVDDVITTASTTVNFSFSVSFFAVQRNTAAAGVTGGTLDFKGSGRYIDVLTYDNTLRWENGSTVPINTIANNYHTTITPNVAYFFSAAGNQSFINGGDALTAARSGELSGPITAPIHVGKYLTDHYNGNIAEVIILPFSATVDQRQRIEGYLAWKWKLQANLPVGHPYKSLPPTV